MLEMNCFMCLEKSDEVLNIFSNNFKSSPVDIIKSHFWFTPTLDNPIICLKCWQTTENFHIFYIKVKEAHENIINKSEIYNSKLKTNEFGKEEVEVEDSIFFNSAEFSCNSSNSDNEFLNQKEEILDSHNVEDDEVYVDNVEDEVLDNVEDKVLDNVKNEVLGNVKNSVQDNVSNDILHNGKDQILDDVKELESRIENSCFDINSKVNDKRKSVEVDTFKESEEYDKKVASFVTLNCMICSSIFPTFGKLKTHFAKAHNANGYAVCCDRKYYKRSLLIDHIDTHMNPEHFKCPICSRTFTNKRTHREHVNNYHVKEKVKYTCCTCSKEFSSTKTLTAHKRTHRPKDEWKFKCNYSDCDKTYASREFLNSHIHHVHKSTTKICDLCGKTFHSAYFRKHMRKHLGIAKEKVECHICNSFLDKKYIKIHVKNHEEADMDHICPTCGKKSPNTKALYKHIYEVHRLKKSHPCAVCKKQFKSKDLLTQHMPVHTGENNFKCSFCNRSFKFNSNLSDHKKKEHYEEFEAEKLNRKKRRAIDAKNAAVNNLKS